MWECKVCNNKIDDDEDFCHHCGNLRNVSLESVEIARDNLEKEKSERERLQFESNPDNYEIDYSTYTRDWLQPIKRLSIRRGILLLISPLFALNMILMGFVSVHHSMTARLLMVVGGLIFLWITIRYINSVTKIFPRKLKQMPLK